MSVEMSLQAVNKDKSYKDKENLVKAIVVQQIENNVHYNDIWNHTKMFTRHEHSCLVTE